MRRGQRDLSVRTATGDEISAVGGVLASAFYDDRMYKWIVPDDAQRARGGADFFTLFARACHPHNAVYRCDDVGAAVWLPPETQPEPDGDAESFGQKLAATTGDDDSAARMAAVVELQDAHHPSEPHWYLAFMGVVPEGQGQGCGSVMLDHVLQDVDRQRMPAYLEASCPENRRLYERHGFRTLGEMQVADCPPLYPMWRDARA